MEPNVLIGAVIGLLILVAVLIFILLKQRQTLRASEAKMRENQELQAEISDLREQVSLILSDRSKILSIVSHDVKTPFNRIYAVLNLLSLESDGLTDNQKQYISMIKMVVSEGLSLIKSLLDIRSIEGGGIDKSFSKLHLLTFLKQQVQKYSATAAEKGMTITLGRELEDDVLESDVQYLDRIFGHMIMNSIKFSSEGSRIQIQVSEKDRGLLITVHDGAPLVPMKERDLLFRKYQATSILPTGKETGSGLGLYIVKSLAEGLRGSAEYKVEGDKGYFCVFLPRVSA